jgi:hypothetical protein
LALVIVLGPATAFNYDWYFHRYDENARRSLWNATEMGAVLRAFEESGGSLQNAYHVAYPHWVDTRNVAINAGHIMWRNVVTDLSQISDQAQQPGRKMYLVFPQHQAALKVLMEVYPHGRATMYVSERPGKSFYVFEVPAREGSSGASAGGRWRNGKVIFGHFLPFLTFFDEHYRDAVLNGVFVSRVVADEPRVFDKT